MRPAFLYCMRGADWKGVQPRKWEKSQERTERPMLRTRHVTIGK